MLRVILSVSVLYLALAGAIYMVILSAPPAWITPDLIGR